MRPLMAGGVGVYLDIAMVGGRRPAAAYDSTCESVDFCAWHRIVDYVCLPMAYLSIISRKTCQTGVLIWTIVKAGIALDRVARRVPIPSHPPVRDTYLVFCSA